MANLQPASAAALPNPEAIILWLRTNLPASAEKVLPLARRYYEDGLSHLPESGISK
jgi:hypothetical protein